MKFEQAFDNCKVIVTLANGVEIGVISIESKVTWMHIKNNTVSWCRRLPIDGIRAFELVNMYQEALALANTKNLSTELLFDLGYVEVI